MEGCEVRLSSSEPEVMGWAHVEGEPEVMCQTFENVTSYDRATMEEMDRRFVVGSGDLAGKRVLVVGCGTLGNLMAQYLLSCGVSDLWLADMDSYTHYNRPRSVLMRADDAGEPKALALARRAAETSPFSCRVTGVVGDVTRMGIGFLRGFDIVATPVDSGPVRMHVSRWCHLLGIHHVSCGTAVMNRGGGMFASTVTVEPAGCKACYEDLCPVDMSGIRKRLSCSDYSPEVSAQVMPFSAAAAGLAVQCMVNLLAGRFHRDETAPDGSPLAWCYSFTEMGFGPDTDMMRCVCMADTDTSRTFWEAAGDSGDIPEVRFGRRATVRDMWGAMCGVFGHDGAFSVATEPTGLLYLAYPAGGLDRLPPVSSLYLDDRDDDESDGAALARMPADHVYLVTDVSGIGQESRLVRIVLEGVE